MGDLAVTGSAASVLGEPVRRRFTTSVEPVRVTAHDLNLGVKVRRIVGYRFRCDCGELGSRRRSMAEARSDGRRHVFDEHIGSPASTSTSSSDPAADIT